MIARLLCFLILVLTPSTLLASVTGFGSRVTGFSDYSLPSVGAANCASPAGSGGTPGEGFTSAACASTDISGTADLSTGVIGAFAECCADPFHTTGQSQTDATFWDTITISVPNGFAGSTIPFVTFHFHVTGAAITGAGNVGNASYISDTLSAIPDFTSFYAQSAHGCISNDAADFCPGVPASLDLTITYPNLIPVSDPKVQVKVFLTAWARGNGASADALDPGFVDVLLPEGFGFSSDSNVLLTVPPVPEPATSLLLAPVLGAMLLRRRRLST